MGFLSHIWNSNCIQELKTLKNVFVYWKILIGVFWHQTQVPYRNYCSLHQPFLTAQQLLKYVFKFRVDFAEILKLLRNPKWGSFYTAESASAASDYAESASAVSDYAEGIIRRSHTLMCASHRSVKKKLNFEEKTQRCGAHHGFWLPGIHDTDGVWLRDVHHTAESDIVVCILYSGVRCSGLHHTTETDFVFQFCKETVLICMPSVVYRSNL